MLNKTVIATIAFSLAAYFVAPASANPLQMNRYDARRGAIILPNGKAVHLSGFWNSRVNPRPQKRLTRPVRASASVGTTSDVPVTHIQGPFAANGPVIAVDPNNPAHLIGSANDYRLGGTSAFVLYSSRDGGASWDDRIGQYMQSFPGDFNVSVLPAVAIDSNSIDYFQTLSLNYNGTDTRSNAVSIARSTPPEADQFVDQFPVAISSFGPTATFFNDQDALAVDNGFGSPYLGSLYSTWTLVDSVNATMAIMEAYSRDHASTFPVRVLVSQPGGAALCTDGGNCLHNEGSSPVVGPNGVVYVAYENDDTPTGPMQILISASKDGGQTFGTPVKVAADYDISASNPYGSFPVHSWPNLAVNPTTGQLYIAWADQRDGSSEIYITTSIDKGQTWSTPKSVAPPYYGAFRFFPAIGVQASTGNVYVSYYDNLQYPARDMYGYYYRKATASLKPLFGPTLVSSTPIIPAIASSAYFGDYTRMATSPLGANLIWTGTQFGEQDIESALVP